MAMLGAQLDELDGLRDRLRVTTTAIEDAGVDARRLTDQVVEACRTAAGVAFDAVGASMGQLSGAVGDAVALAGSTSWTGANRDRFLDDTNRFHAAMADVERAATDAFEAYRANVEQLAASLEEFQARLAVAMADAATSTEGMATAVEAQRTNLDAVMNQGLGVG